MHVVSTSIVPVICLRVLYLVIYQLNYKIIKSMHLNNNANAANAALAQQNDDGDTDDSDDTSDGGGYQDIIIEIL